MTHKFDDYSIIIKHKPANFFHLESWIGWVYFKNELISHALERSSESAVLSAAAFDIKRHQDGMRILTNLTKG